MGNTNSDYRRWGYTRLIVASGLLIAGLYCVFDLAQAQTSNKKTKTAVKPTGPMTLKMTIASEGSDVQEMSKLINEKLEASWKTNNITPSHYIDDYEFIRRASLDIIGRIAKPEEIRRFMKDSPDRRRSLLIDRLLAHEDYPLHWANLWSNWLLTRAGDFGRGTYHDQTVDWLKDQFAQNKGYHEIVTKLITAKGSNKTNGAVNFMLAHVGESVPAGKRREEGMFEMVPLTSRITRVFLGTQVQCAQCHAHPFFGTMKQEQFWGINAFLRQIKREGVIPRRQQRNQPKPELTLTDDESVNLDANVFFEMRNGKVRMWHAEFLPATGKERGPKLDPSKKGLERREELAKFVVEHEMFTKAIVNRMWGLFYGRGFVNPIDDFNDNNPPSNPELLSEIAARFKHYNYDLKKLIRWLTHANAYHRSYVANPTNDKPEHETQFSRMIMKSLTPEQLFESLMTATQADSAMTPADKKRLKTEWLDQLITNFGDDEGNEVTFNGTIVQALLMMNGKNINDAITSTKGTIATTMKSKRTGSAIIDELYLAALNRPAKRSESTRITGELRLRAGIRDSSKAFYEDIFWALLNSNEFILNH